MTSTAPGLDNMRGRLVDYAPWMARDYMTNQGPSTTIVVMLFGFLALSPAAAMQRGIENIPPQVLNQLLVSLTAPLAVIGVLFATNGIIANDRKLGYYRFLFSKPVSPAAYYATTFLVNGVGFLVVCLALTAVWSVSVRPLSPVGVLLAGAIMYLAYGGLGFLFSAAWRFDWISLVIVLLGANFAWARWGDAEGLHHWLLYLLPPVQRASDVYVMVLRDAARPVPWLSIVWLLGYGAMCFVLGLVVVRRRPLGIS